MRVLIYGLGRSGRAALERVRGAGHAVWFHDAIDPSPDTEAAEASGATRIPVAAEADVDLVIAAPGVRWNHPDLVRLRERGLPVIGEVEWVWRTVPGVYLGVTGTAGKGSVSSWLTDVLQQVGRGSDAEPVLGGNVDPALSRVARDHATHVVEMSSFQLERCPTFSADVGIVLNVGEDHIDAHGDLAAYRAAKRRLVDQLAPGATLVANADDPLVATWADAADARGVRVRRFSLAGPGDAWLDGTVLHLGATPLLDASELGVPGRHQIANALAVALAAEARGIAPTDVARALPRFRGLPGRYAVVHEHGDLRIIEDSIATRPLAVVAALRSAPPPVVWIAGGADKGADPAEALRVAAERVSLFIGIGESGPRLADALPTSVARRTCAHGAGRDALRCAVRTGLAHLREAHGGRGTILLAPLAASFDQFADYRERASVFRDVVAEEIR